jgi:glycine amidinotransferase
MSLVNSYDGFTPLEEVVLGWPYHLGYDDDVSFRLFFWNGLRMKANASVDGPWTVGKGSDFELRLAEECAEDTAALAAVLEQQNVTVRRPRLVEEPVEFSTPDWSSALEHSVMPRDPFIVIGDEIIETPPLVRSRMFEWQLYQSLFTEYFRSGARWTVVPRSRMLPENFDFSYVAERGWSGPVPAEPDHQIMFDGAQILRVGRDLVFNTSTENHRMGVTWLRRHLGDGYRVHEISITDNHLDAEIAVLRPGVLLLNEKLDVERLPKFLQGWKVIRHHPVRVPIAPNSFGGRPVLASAYLGMNVLSIDEEKILVEENEKELITDLEDAGFTPIPCRWRHGRLIAGSFHCMTLDIRRRGSLVDYS